MDVEVDPDAGRGAAGGRAPYPDAARLLITADGGGSNGYRTRQWKTELAALATQTGLTITVCHLPPGTSKWNKIEHRLFAHIQMNWRGRPLTSHEVIINTIAATTTSTGLTVHAELDQNDCRTPRTVGSRERYVALARSTPRSSTSLHTTSVTRQRVSRSGPAPTSRQFSACSDTRRPR